MGRSGPLVFSQKAHDYPLDRSLILGDEDGLHRRVGRLQTDLLVLPVELLESGLLSVEKRDHDFPVPGVGAALDDDVVPVADLLVHHRLPPHLEEKHVPPPDHVLGHRHELVPPNRLDGLAGGDETLERDVARLGLPLQLDELDRPGPIPMPLDEALLLQIDQMLVNGRNRMEFEVGANLVQTRGVAILAYGVFDEAQDLLLSLRQDHETFSKRFQRRQIEIESQTKMNSSKNED